MIDASMSSSDAAYVPGITEKAVVSKIVSKTKDINFFFNFNPYYEAKPCFLRFLVTIFLKI